MASLAIAASLLASLADQSTSHAQMPERAFLQADGMTELECLLRRLLGLPCEADDPGMEPDPPPMPVQPLI